MQAREILRVRGNRLIALCRLFVATMSIAIISIDPERSAQEVQTVYLLMGPYSLYAGLLVLWKWHLLLGGSVLLLVTHVIDLVMLSTLMYLTDAPVSPFFLLFVFSLLAGTIRWGWQGAIGTAGAVFLLLIAITVIDAWSGEPAEMDVTRLGVRGMYLMIAGTMLAYVGAHEERVHQEISRLASWPHDVVVAVDVPTASHALQHAAAVFGTGRTMLTWQEDEGSRMLLSLYQSGDLRQHRLEPGQYEPLVPEPLADADFLQLKRGRVLAQTDRLFAWHGNAIHPAFGQDFEIEYALSIRVHARSGKGRLWVLDPRNLAPDDFVIGRIIARQIAAEIDRRELLKQLHKAAVTEERIALARDLHDSILQSLAGIGMRIAALAPSADRADAQLAQELQTLQGIVESEQRHLRQFIRQLGPDVSPGRSRGISD